MKMKSETGRSMVEMLGVLAIIGVLSIGGIAGYTLSMRKHRASKLLDIVNKYAVFAYGSCQGAVVNGTITGLASCSFAHVPLFKDANLGIIAEAESISFGKITQDSGIDVVNIQTNLFDEKVCMATKNIAGAITINNCSYISQIKAYALDFNVKMN